MPLDHNRMEWTTGIGPAFGTWQAPVLPLHHAHMEAQAGLEPARPILQTGLSPGPGPWLRWRESNSHVLVNGQAQCLYATPQW